MVYFARTNLFGFVTNLEKDRVGIRIMYIDGKESKISPGDTVHGTTKYLDRDFDMKEPDFYLAVVRSMLWQTKDQYGRFKATCHAEYLEWYNFSEAERECLRNTYCTKYAIFNAYHAMHYLTSLISGMKINVKFNHELISAVMEDLVISLISLNSMDECKKPLAILSEIVSEGMEHDQDDSYQGDDKRIMGLLKAYLALNKQQLNELKDCSITDFESKKRANHEFVAFFELHRLCEDLDKVTGVFCFYLDEKLAYSVDWLLDWIKADSTFSNVESLRKKWTYHDAIHYWHKVIDIDQDISLDLANLPQTENFKVPLCNIFDPRCEYDYMSVYKEFRIKEKELLMWKMTR
jgi:hypothetical protein